MPGIQNPMSAHEGTVVIKPIQANFYKNDQLVGKMDPYCKFYIGDGSVAKTEVCKDGSLHPYWDDILALKKKGDEQFLHCLIKNKNLLGGNKDMGLCKIELKTLDASQETTQWYNVFAGNLAVAKLLLSISFKPTDEAPQKI